MLMRVGNRAVWPVGAKWPVCCAILFLESVRFYRISETVRTWRPNMGADGWTRSVFSVEIPIEHYVINIRG